jgi:allophanate hydrolase subunit 1
MDAVDSYIFEECQKARFSLVGRLGEKIITEDSHDERIKKMLKYVRFYLNKKIEAINNLIVKYKKYKGKNVRADIMANIRDEINLLMKAKQLITLDIKYIENKANKVNKPVNKIVKKQCHRSIACYSKDN